MDAKAAKIFGRLETHGLKSLSRKDYVESKCDIKIDGQDPKSSFALLSTIEALNLNPKLLKGVHEMGFKIPTKLQEIILPILLEDSPRNLIVQSLFGTGKTVAFVLAMLSRVNPSKHYPQVLCLSPTCERAIRTGELVSHMAKFFPEIEFKFALQGEEIPRGAKITEHILIGTPGRVLDWGIKYRAFDLDKISVFVMDEADVTICTEGHQDQCIRIQECLDQECQMMFFSTTYHQEVMEYIEAIVPNPLIIRLGDEKNNFDNIQQYYVKCVNKQEKYDAIINIKKTVEEDQAIIIFCYTKRAVTWLSDKMTKDGYAVAVLNGELTVAQRIGLLDRFRTGQEKVLITNVFLGGINVDKVTTVINYDLPVEINGNPDYATYLYRVGRIAKFGKMGIVINLIDSPQDMLICKNFEKHFYHKIKFLDTNIGQANNPVNKDKKLVELDAMKKLLETMTTINEAIKQNMKQLRWHNEEIKLMKTDMMKMEMSWCKEKKELCEKIKLLESKLEEQQQKKRQEQGNVAEVVKEW